MLAFHNSYGSNVYMDDIADMICHIYHFHLDQYYIQQKHDPNRLHLC